MRCENGQNIEAQKSPDFREKTKPGEPPGCGGRVAKVITKIVRDIQAVIDETDYLTGVGHK